MFMRSNLVNSVRRVSLITASLKSINQWRIFAMLVMRAAMTNAIPSQAIYNYEMVASSKGIFFSSIIFLSSA